uniref:GRAM domain containing 2B n=1 Tax=Oryzias latipes TaxID=8090 RepID=A0A3B3I1T8_ORYLA
MKMYLNFFIIVLLSSSLVQLSKSNSHYHKIFKEISKDEQLRQSYTCALQKDILYQGRMFVSDNWICFHSKVFGRDTKIAIPVTSITNIKKTKTAILLPNALVVATYVFVSFLSRDNTYKFLISACLHLEVRKSSHTTFPVPDISDRVGGRRQRSPESEESSSSDSQNLEYDKMAGNHRKPTYSANIQSLFQLKVCILVLSSCYLTFRIVSLEQRLSSLSLVPDLRLHDILSRSAEVNTELFSELLTVNLLKLEKVGCSRLTHVKTDRTPRVSPSPSMPADNSFPFFVPIPKF